MKKNKYDIFISYRRDLGAQYARSLQLILEQKGYRVFLDYDELKDGQFSPKIEAAIQEAPIYIIILTKGALVRCSNEGDWVRREIEVALREKKHIIPLNPDNTFDGIPDNIPDAIKSAIGETQYSEINFGQMLRPTVDLMDINRINPNLKKRGKPFWPIALVVALFLSMGIWYIWQWKQNHDLESLKESITFNGQSIEWADDIDIEQLQATQELLSSMRQIDGGRFMQGAQPMSNGSYHEYVEVDYETPALDTSVNSFYMAQFEVTIRQWNAIMRDKREGNPSLPIGNVTFKQAKEFAKELSNLTTMDFRLPTETEWEYAAKGGSHPEDFMFAGSNNPKEVAFYAANSNGVPHSDTLAIATIDDLFNMSGNVSEWCDTPFKPYDPEQLYNKEGTMTIRGGNYDSDEYEITVTHREPVMPDTSIPTLGFRIALSK